MTSFLRYLLEQRGIKTYKGIEHDVVCAVSLAGGLVFLDFFFNKGQITGLVVETFVKCLDKYKDKETKIVYVLKDELTDLGFGC